MNARPADGSERSAQRLRVTSDPRVPVVAVLVLAGFFDGISGNPIHALVLVGAAAVLGLDSMRSRSRPPSLMPQPLRLPRHGGVGAVALGFALLVGGFGRYSYAATLPVAAAGALGVGIAWQQSARVGPVTE